MKLLGITLLCCAAAFHASGQAPAPVATALGAYSQSLQAPARVAVDAAGNLYVTDPVAGRVAVYNTFGILIGTHTGFVTPLAIAVAAQGNIYLAEQQPGRVSVFDSQWNLRYQLGAGDGEFQLPNHIALDPGAGSNFVYVSDSSANLIKVYAGATLINQFGSAGTGDGQFNFPTGISVSATGEVFVVDQNNDRVQVFDRAGGFKRSYKFGSAFMPSGRKQGALVDAAGRLYVADTFQGFVQVYDAATGDWLATVGRFGELAGQLRGPTGLTLDSLNRLYVASPNNSRVELYGIDSYLHLTTQPAGKAIAAGTNLVLQALAGGTGPFTFQWQKDGANLSDATNATFAIASVTATDAGGYSVLVNGPAGTRTSGVTQVAVLVPPAIVSGPQSLAVLSGTNVTLTVSTLGSELAYQWQRNGLNLDGATNSTLSLTDVQPWQNGDYSVLVQNPVGSSASAPATLTVFIPPSLMQVLSSGMGTDQFYHVSMMGDVGFTFALDISTNLFEWQAQTIFVNDGSTIEFVDTGTTNLWQRFYRLRWVPVVK